MKNQSVSDFVASAMDAVLKSEAHNTLFGTHYKTASDELLASDHKEEEDCSLADDNDARKKKDSEDMTKKLQFRLEQECINYLLYIINNSKEEYVGKSNSINILTRRIKKWCKKGLNVICMLNWLEIKF